MRIYIALPGLIFLFPIFAEKAASASNASVFTVTSPLESATISKKVKIKGRAGAQWLNVAVYDVTHDFVKVGLDTVPVKGRYSIAVDTTKIPNGDVALAVIAFSVKPGQVGGTSQRLDLNLTVSNNTVNPSPSPQPTVVPQPPAPSPTPSPTPTPTAGTLPPPIANLDYVMTFNDEFTSLSDISASSTYDGSKWYNGTEQCCMGDSSNLPGVMFPTVYNGVSINPYSIMPGGGLNITLSKVNDVWYSGVMTSVDSAGRGFSQQYGYFEIVAKFPVGPGTWPAFWMLDTDHLTSGKAGGEIDIFEQYGQFPDKFCTTYHDWAAGTAPYYNCDITVSEQTKGFHTYGFLWTATDTTIYVDNIPVAHAPTPAIMQQPYYMLVDLGLGGGWPTEATPSPSTMQVKSVRAYAPR